MVIIILAAIFLNSSNGVIGEAAYARFVSEIYQVQNGVYNARVENARVGDTEDKINANFTKVTLKNAPEEFESFDTQGGKTTGYAIDLKYLNYDNTDYGKKYSADKRELEFDKDDVYVYDATGSVYYVKGIYYEKNDDVVYSIANITEESLGSTDDGPFIHSIIVSSGELEDGTKTNAKAKITITATPRNGGALTVMVRNNIAEKKPEGTFVTQVSRNGTYAVVVTEENGGRTVSKAVVTGIQESTLPPNNLSMLINGGASFTTERMANITLRADGALYKMITENALRPNASDSRWESYETEFTYDLGASEGMRTLYAWFKDEYGNVTEKIVKASITYDASAPDNAAPDVAEMLPYVLLTCNQKDGDGTSSQNLQILYGYRISDGKTGYEDDFIWSTSRLLGPLENKTTYDFVTMATDEAGNKTISRPTTREISYKYIIQYDLQGGTGDFPDGSVKEDESYIILPAEKPEKQGYEFVGWSENKDASPDSTMDIVRAGATYTPTGTVATKTLYAIWKASLDTEYEVHHYVELPGTLDDYQLVRVEKLTGETDKYAYALPKTEGEFAYYIENENHRNRLVMDRIKADGSTKLRIYYHRKEFTLTLKGEHGTLTPREQQVGYGVETTISVVPDDGYLFSEWQIEGEESTSSEYNNFTSENKNRVASAKFQMPGHDVVLNAVLEAKLYHISYHGKGTTETPNPESYTRETPAFTLINPTVNGYDFAGWIGTDLSEPTTTVTIDPSKITKMEDRDYTATYAPNAELLTMTKDKEGNTNGTVNVTIHCLDTDPNLIIEYKIGEGDSWTSYTRDQEIPVSENATVYARLLSEDRTLIDEERIIVNNIDKEKPVITNVEISNTWTAGTALVLKITATDNIAVTGYAITSSETRPSDSSFVSEETCHGILPFAREGVNYVWVKDEAGNATSKMIKAWDVSKVANAKNVYAFLPEESELRLVGTGETKAYTDETVPYKEDKTKIQKVVVEEGVTSLNNHILSKMRNVKEIDLPKTLTTINDDALIYTNQFEKIEIAKGNTSFTCQDNTLLDSSKQTIYIHSAKDTSPTYHIPSTVTEIKKLAFYENQNIRKVTTTSNPSVGAYAFEKCSLLEELEGQVGGSKISEGAFKECSNLSKLVLSSELVEIGDRAFYETEKIGNMTIPKTVEIVGGSVNEVFKNIGIASNNGEGKGIVRYYASSDDMNRYANRFAEEAIFVPIDDEGPRLNSFRLFNPASGVYPAGTVLTFVATFNEEIVTEHLTLVIKVGGGVNKTIRSGVISGNTITYTCITSTEDAGEVRLISYTGTATDAAENVSNISTTTMTGSSVIINTMVKLEEGTKTWYFAKLQDAISYAKVSPEIASKITLLEDLTESVAIPNNKVIELVLNGKTLTAESGKVGIQNSGKLTILGAGKVTGGEYDTISNTTGARLRIVGAEVENLGSSTPSAISVVAGAMVNLEEVTITANNTGITNRGTVIATNTSITSQSYDTIQNYGEISLTGGEVISSGTNNSHHAILNKGTGKIIIDGATIRALKIGIETEASSELIIKGSTKIEVKWLGISNRGKMTIENVEMENVSNADKLIHNNGGEIIINDGTFKNVVSNHSLIGVDGNSRITINGGTFLSPNYMAFSNDKSTAQMTINGGSIISKTPVNNKGNLTINQGATFTATSTYVVKNTGITTINGGTFTSTGIGALQSSSDITVENATITVTGTTQEVIAVNLTSTAKGTINNTSITASATSGNATGVKVSEDAELNTNQINVKATSTSGTGTAVSNMGTVTLGTDEGFIRNSQIKLDGSTYGYLGGNASTFSFYDGTIIGNAGNAISGTVTNQPEKTYIKKTTASGRETAILEKDIDAPNITLTASTEEWTAGNVTVTGSATENESGIIAYALNSSLDVVQEAEWRLVEKTNHLEITETIEETKTLYLHVKDAIGNVGVSNKVEVKIDKDAPTILNVSLEKEGWVAPNAVVRVNATDNGSGICAFEFTNTYREVNATGNYTQIAPTAIFDRTIPTGNAHWYIYVKDAAGNVAYEHFHVANVDVVLPEIEVTEYSHTEEETKIKIAVTEEHSGIESITVNGQVLSYEDSITREDTVEGIYTITEPGVYIIKAEDQAGNLATKVVNVYMISYVPNGGTGENKYRIKVENISVEVIENTYTRPGYVFRHWNTKIDNSGTSYVAGNDYEENENSVLFAIWRDQIPPTILDVILSKDHVSGQNPMLKIIAEDNEMVTGYAITKSSTTPAVWNNTADITASEGDGRYYVWVKDGEGNVTSGEIKLYDVSRDDDPKSVFAIQKVDAEEENKITLSIEGEGRTQDYTRAALPWKDDLTIITNVQVKREVERLGHEILGHLENVEEMILSDSLTTVEIDTFIHSNSVEQIMIQGGNFVFVDGMLMDSGETIVYIASIASTPEHVSVPTSVEELAPYAFENTNAKEVAISHNIDLPEGAFKNAALLEQIIAPDGIGGKHIGTSALEGCLSLTDITISDELEVIGDRAFYQTESLEAITIPKTVTTLEGKNIFANTNPNGEVYYYVSCDAMITYAEMDITTKDQANFIPIDDIPPTADAPTARSSTSTIVVTCQQTDAHSGIAKIEYNIRGEGEEYSEDAWKEERSFTGLTAETTYFVKTRATDRAGNVTESFETVIVTKKVPDQISLTAVPSTPTSGDVIVVVEWPQSAIDELYGEGWPEGTTVKKQVKVQTPSGTGEWEEVSDSTGTTNITISQNHYSVYARLSDGVNVTTQTISLTVTNIDRIAPTGSININHNQEITKTQDVTLVLSAEDDRTEVGYGVKYYYASESSQTPIGDVSLGIWEEYFGDGEYDFRLSSTMEDKTVYVWYMDAAGNVSTPCSDSIQYQKWAVRLEQDGETTFYETLIEGINEVSMSHPNVSSRLTILKNIKDEYPLVISNQKNVIFDMNGYNITVITNETIKGFQNNGILVMENTDTAKDSKLTVITDTGNAFGIYNTGLLKVDGVSIDAKAPNGTAIGIYNER